MIQFDERMVGLKHVFFVYHFTPIFGEKIQFDEHIFQMG